MARARLSSLDSLRWSHKSYCRFCNALAYTYAKHKQRLMHAQQQAARANHVLVKRESKDICADEGWLCFPSQYTQ